MNYKLLEVSGESCANCYTLLPVARRLAAERGIPLEHLELTEQTAVKAQALAVERVPTLILYKGEEEIARCTGYQPEEILEVWLDAKTGNERK